MVTKNSYILSILHFHFMKDLSLPNYNSSKIVTRILEGKIPFEKIQAAAHYKFLIEPRLKALIHIKESLDNEFTLLILYLS